jgi:soluble lytic murein transglycosylase-like protein
MDGLLAYDIEALLDAIRQVESGGNRNAISNKGALGDMQQMIPTMMDPGYDIPTMFDVARMYGMEPEPTEGNAIALAKDPEVARRFAYEYMDKAQREFGNDMDRMLMSYNAGIPAVKFTEQDALPKEARDYAPKVRAAYLALTGQELPALGYSAAPAYKTVAPRRRPAGLLSMQPEEE